MQWSTAGLHRQTVHQARIYGRLTALMTPVGIWLIRRSDAERFHLDRQLPPPSREWRLQQLAEFRQRTLPE
jgi:hypothetical protein